jgi:hypothetical protein
MIAAGAAAATGGAVPLAAQQFHPPAVQSSSGGGTRLGLFGFGVRGGIDLSGSQLAFGVTLDAGNLFTERFHLRPSAEIGLFNGRNSYVGSFEGVYRFTSDAGVAVPYAGGGMSVAGHDACGSDPGCPAIWANVLVGLELHYRSTFNWLFEYHAMDAFKHNRFYVGLTTRRGI